jgi:GTPase SAR1 family protein
MLGKKDKKKIVLIGPPASGKTTIIDSYFKCVNPVKLLEFSLEPTKGINSEIYEFFDLNLGIYDLAGQENQNWFFDDRSVFYDSDMVICIFDITDSLKSIINFLIRIFNIRSELNLSFCVLVFLHKIDLVTATYPKLASKFIENQLTIKDLKEFDLKIFHTSISEKFFWNSYDIILSLLHSFNKKEEDKILKHEMDNLKKETQIILKFKYKIHYSIYDIRNHFPMKINQIQFHIKRLKQMGFVRIPTLEPTTFYLTNRAYWFKLWIKDKIKLEQELDKEINVLFNILNLKKIGNIV